MNLHRFSLLLLSLSWMSVSLNCSSAADSNPSSEIIEHNDLMFAEPGGVQLLMDVHLPVGVEKPPLLMYIHGGGWTGGDRKHASLRWALKRGYAIARIEYRMSYEAIFPAQIHDCKGALRWLRAHQDEYGYDAERVVVAGSSAGGHLAALMGTSGGVKSLEGTVAGHLDQSSRVQAVIDYFGPTDFLLRSKNQPSKTDNPNGSVYKLLGGPVSEQKELARLASPATHVDAGDPPLLMLHGEKDQVVHLSQSKRLLAAYKEQGLDARLHVEPGKGHGWKPPTKLERKLVLQFLAAHLKQKSATTASQ